MIAAEVRSAELSFSSPSHSFEAPSPNTRLSLGTPFVPDEIEHSEGYFQDCLESSEDVEKNTTEIGYDTTVISRKTIRLEGVQFFSSFLTNEDGDFFGQDKVSFAHFFALSGRAEEGKLVYEPVVDIGPENDLFDEFTKDETKKRASCRWKSLSGSSVSFDVTVDHCPRMRILLSDNAFDTPSSLSLHCSLHDFGLLLSIWYDNMQELPTMFPYSESQIDLSNRLKRPDDPPELGTQACKDFLLEDRPISSEFLLSLGEMSLYLYKDTPLTSIGLDVSGGILHVLNDSWPLTKVALSAKKARMVDTSTEYGTVLECDCPYAEPWADFSFGVNENIATIQHNLNHPLQLTIFMTTSWSIYNLGLIDAKISLSDMSPILRFLEHVTSYFADCIYGNPLFEIRSKVDEWKTTISDSKEADFSGDNITPSAIDFRLWLKGPELTIPLVRTDDQVESVIVSTRNAMWYRYLGLENHCSHEFISKDAEVAYVRGLENSSNMDRVSIIKGLCLGLRYDVGYETNHSDVMVQIPFTDPNGGDLSRGRLALSPKVLEAPKICVPFAEPERLLGESVTEVTMLVDIFPKAYGAFARLFGDSSTTFLEDDVQVDEAPKVNEGVRETTSVVCHISDFRVFLLDHLLRAHLPVAMLSLSSFDCTLSSIDSIRDDSQLILSSFLWVDYFKLGLTRSWEPLVEPFRLSLFEEISRLGGKGINIISDTPIQCNVSGAMLLVVDEVIDSLSMVLSKENPTSRVVTGNPSLVPTCFRSYLSDQTVVHEIPEILQTHDRVAFSIRNLSGDSLRTFRKDDSGNTVVTYLRNLQSSRLLFYPSISVIKNLNVVEDEFPGLLNSPTSGDHHKHRMNMKHTVDVQIPGFQCVPDIEVDTFGRSFRNILPLNPRITEKMSNDWRLRNLMKILVEVGLENGGRQVSVRSLFSVINKTTFDVSLFSHPDPTVDPNETQNMGGDESSVILAGNSFQIPILLTQCSLDLPGNHIGSIWFRPHVKEWNDLAAPSSPRVKSSETPQVCMSSRPMQLVSLVHESSRIFHANNGRDVPTGDCKTGAQISCPVLSEGKHLAPFCFALEVGRSPLVKSATDGKSRPMKTKDRLHMHGPVAYTLSLHAPFVVANLLPVAGRFELMHALRRTVVWYGDLRPGEQVPIHSVGLDAPLLLLLNLGFCRTPVGEGALVHQGSEDRSTREIVGGLKLISKVGVAATKKASAAVTKKLGKTITSLGESPDKRGIDRLNKAQSPRSTQSQEKTKGAILKPTIEDNRGTRQEKDTNMFHVDANIFRSQDIDEETCVVDSVGQRLKVGINNMQGGGGQRQISIFCPFWIVNTTEHSFLYRQENTKSFVCGSVHSEHLDGSRPLSDGRARAMYSDAEPRNEDGDVNFDEGSLSGFAGTAGALASSSTGICRTSAEEVCNLIDENLDLSKQAELAFMFNFTDTGLSLGQERFCMRLYDGRGNKRYRSDWSRGFSLDSVGFSHVVR